MKFEETLSHGWNKMFRIFHLTQIRKLRSRSRVLTFAFQIKTREESSEIQKHHKALHHQVLARTQSASTESKLAIATTSVLLITNAAASATGKTSKILINFHGQEIYLCWSIYRHVSNFVWAYIIIDIMPQRIDIFWTLYCAIPNFKFFHTIHRFWYLLIAWLRIAIGLGMYTYGYVQLCNSRKQQWHSRFADTR